MAKETSGTKLCKHCKTEIPAGAKVCPNCRKKQGGKLKWVIVGLVVFFVLVGVFGGSEETEGTKQASSGSNNSSSDDSGQTQEGEPEEPVEEEKYYVGDTWKNKYVLVSYDKCGEYESDNEFIQPADGNKYVYATFTFENVGDSDTTVGYWDFDCYADGYACEGTYPTDDSGFTQTLSAGRKIEGTIYFEVPVDTEEIEFEFSPSFWSSKKVVFVYE